MRSAWIRFWIRAAAVAALFLVVWFGAAAVVPAGAHRSLATGLDGAVPYLPELAPVYLAGYLLPALPLALVRDPVVLLPGLTGLAVMIAAAGLVFLAFPVAVPAPPWRGRPDLPPALALIDSFGALDGNCFPSLHVGFASFVVTGLMATRHAARWLALPLAAAIALSTVALRLHFVVDVPAGAALGVLCARAFAWPAMARWWAGR